MRVLIMTLEFVGPVRELLISLEAVHVFICIQLTVIFIYQGIKNKETVKENLGWAIIFASFGIMTLLKILRVFYFDPGSWLEVNLNNWYNIIPFLVIVIFLEYFLQKYQKTYYLFSIPMAGISCIILFVPVNISELLSTVGMVLIIVFGILFLAKLINLSTGIVRRNINLFLTSVFLWMFGSFLTNQRSMNNFLLLGINVSITMLIGIIIQIGSLIGIALIITKLPIFLEVNWENKMIQLYIIHREKGTPIYNINFKQVEGEEEDNISADLIAGGWAGITTMMKEISGSTTEIRVIDHGDQKIMLEHGDKYLIALNVEEEMLVYRERIRKLRKYLEAEFTDILEDWDGNMKAFEPIAGAVETIFR